MPNSVIPVAGRRSRFAEAGKRIVYYNIVEDMYGFGIPAGLDYFMSQDFSKKIFE